MLQLLRARLRAQAFQPGLLSLLFSPNYLIRSRLHRRIAALAPHIKGRVLDFGCGSKPYESLFGAASHYVGVDIARGAGSRADLIYDGRRLPFADASFDAIVCFEVLEHLFEPELLLPELQRVLRPGAPLLLSLPFAWEEHEVPYDCARYTRYGLAHLLRRHGWQLQQLDTSGSAIVAIMQLLLSYLCQQAMPAQRWLAMPLRALLVPTLNLSALLCERLLPAGDSLYCNLVALALKPGAAPAAGTETPPALDAAAPAQPA